LNTEKVIKKKIYANQKVCNRKGSGLLSANKRNFKEDVITNIFNTSWEVGHRVFHRTVRRQKKPKAQ